MHSRCGQQVFVDGILQEAPWGISVGEIRWADWVRRFPRCQKARHLGHPAPGVDQHPALPFPAFWSTAKAQKSLGPPQVDAGGGWRDRL